MSVRSPKKSPRLDAFKSLAFRQPPQFRLPVTGEVIVNEERRYFIGEKSLALMRKVLVVNGTKYLLRSAVHSGSALNFAQTSSRCARKCRRPIHRRAHCSCLATVPTLPQTMRRGCRGFVQWRTP